MVLGRTFFLCSCLSTPGAGVLSSHSLSSSEPEPESPSPSPPPPSPPPSSSSGFSRADWLSGLTYAHPPMCWLSVRCFGPESIQRAGKITRQGGWADKAHIKCRNDKKVIRSVAGWGPQARVVKSRLREITLIIALSHRGRADVYSCAVYALCGFVRRQRNTRCALAGGPGRNGCTVDWVVWLRENGGWFVTHPDDLPVHVVVVGHRLGVAPSVRSSQQIVVRLTGRCSMHAWLVLPRCRCYQTHGNFCDTGSAGSGTVHSGYRE